MFNKLLRKNNRELRQRIVELEKTCCDLEDLIDVWKERSSRKDFKISELEWRLKLNDQEKLELNNVISNLMEERNKLTTKKTKRKIEADNHDKATSI